MLPKSINHILNAKHKVKETIISKLKNNSGMEMLQVVLIIAIAAALGVVLVTFFTGDFFDEFRDQIMDRLDELFGD